MALMTPLLLPPGWELSKDRPIQCLLYPAKLLAKDE